MFICGLLMGMFTITVIYSISLYFGYKIYVQLNKMKSLSQRTKHLQRRLTTVLIVKVSRNLINKLFYFKKN